MVGSCCKIMARDQYVRKREWSLKIANDDYIGRVVASSHRPYEYSLLFASLIFAKRGTVVDVGANIGNHAMFWAVFTAAKVECFEPNPEAIEILNQNVSGFGDRVVVHGHALGAKSGLVGMSRVDGNLGATSVCMDASDGVSICTLDDVRLSDVSLLKIDVEGMEPDVLAGARTLLSTWKPVVWLEALGVDALAESRLELERAGYSRRPLAINSSNFLFLPGSLREFADPRMAAPLSVLAFRVLGTFLRRQERKVRAWRA